LIIVELLNFRFALIARLLLLSSERQSGTEKKQRHQISTSAHIEAQNQDESPFYRKSFRILFLIMASSLVLQCFVYSKSSNLRNLCFMLAWVYSVIAVSGHSQTKTGTPTRKRFDQTY